MSKFWRKLSLPLAAGMVCAVLSGCTSVKTVRNFHDMNIDASPRTEPVAQIEAKMNGFYLFGALPIFTGSKSRAGACAVFSDSVNLEYTYFHMMRTARKLGANTLINATTRESSTNFLFLFSMRSVECGGTAVYVSNQDMSEADTSLDPTPDNYY